MLCSEKVTWYMVGGDSAVTVEGAPRLV
jgi:hypothetical protein